MHETKQDCLRFLTVVEQVNTIRLSFRSHLITICDKQHTNIIPSQELVIIQTSVHEMLNTLDDASRTSSDPPDAPPIITSYINYTGLGGRPSINLDPDILTSLIELRGPTHLAQVFGCSARTVRRRALEYGLVEPGQPVYVDVVDESGETIRFFTSSTSNVSKLSDDELDSVTRQIFERFPNFGRRMIDGHFKHLGHRVPRRRIQESYTRVHGPPIGAFGPRRIQRRVYKVPGPNSLSHHDGQHGTSLLSLLHIFHSFIYFEKV